MEHGYLIHSKGPWKNAKYVSKKKIGDKWVYYYKDGQSYTQQRERNARVNKSGESIKSADKKSEVYKKGQQILAKNNPNSSKLNKWPSSSTKTENKTEEKKTTKKVAEEEKSTKKGSGSKAKTTKEKTEKAAKGSGSSKGEKESSSKGSSSSKQEETTKKPVELKITDVREEGLKKSLGADYKQIIQLVESTDQAKLKQILGPKYESIMRTIYENKKSAKATKKNNQYGYLIHYSR